MQKKSVGGCGFLNLRPFLDLILCTAKMNKQSTTTLIKAFRCSTFFVVLMFLGVQVIPNALGQRHQITSKKSSDAPSHPEGGNWTVTGSLNTGRFLHSATVLPNGIVLVTGGLDSAFHAIATTELYDPGTGTWTATGNLNTARYEHTATLLPNGNVLVAGGSDSTGNASATAELYDPSNGTWTSTGDLNTAR